MISRWLARHVSDDELLRALEPAGRGGLTADQAEAVEELRRRARRGAASGAELEMVARETLEALALG